MFVLCIFSIVPACTANAASIGLTAVPGAFNPSTGPVKISYTLNDSGKAEVGLSIMDNNGTVVNLRDASGLTGLTGNVSWDGKMADGMPAPEGNSTDKGLRKHRRICQSPSFSSGGARVSSLIAPAFIIIPTVLLWTGEETCM